MTAARRRSLVAPLVTVALVVRLVTLAIGMYGLVGRPLTVQAFVAVILLAGTSIVGLLHRRALDVVLAHPGIAMVDVLLVLGVLIVLGVGSPLILATLSTALLVGVLFPARVAMLLGFCLACGYIGVLDPGRGNTSVDGDSFLLVVGVPVMYACLVAIGQSFRWISSRQAVAEAALREAAEAAAAADERARLAREMHDSFAKTLQGIALGCTALVAWIERDTEEATSQARALGAAAEQAVREARDLLCDLRRDRPQEPFLDVLTATCEVWAAEEGMRCAVEAPGSLPDPPARVRYQLLAATGEALQNVARHAAARSVSVFVDTDDTDVVLRIADDGRGFDPDVIPEREHEGHFGLRGISERLADVGGSASVISQPGAGTTVTMRTPLGARREESYAGRLR
ncbi:MAG TPA: histidine kinase [Acidimicrobiales bacterium]|nr:histidine kinase [Acidimicrobiales bacterium]